MCGIFFSTKTLSDSEIRNVELSLRHRGPDFTSIDSDAGFTAVVTRLAIQGNLENPIQPVICECGRWKVWFNGEIYNWDTLACMNNWSLKYSCDAEIIPRLLCDFGITGLTYLRGMWAIIALDTRNNSVLAVSDPLGIKPLYTSKDETGIHFASESRTLLNLEKSFTLDLQSIAQFSSYGYLHGNRSMSSNITRLRPGTVYSLNLKSLNLFQHEISINSDEDIRSNLTHDLLEGQLIESVQLHCKASTPIAISFSGGLDSSFIAWAAKSSNIDAHLICLKSRTPNSESNLRHIAEILEYEITFVENKVDWRLMIDYLKAMDVPSIDGLNIFMVSRKAADFGYKVLLSGTGGDELFASYPHQKFSNLRGFLLRSAILLPNRVVFCKPLRRLIKNPHKIEFVKNNFNSFETLKELNFASYRANGFSHQIQHYDFLTDKNISNKFSIKKTSNSVKFIEFENYLMPLLLRDADTFGMANGVEVRVPFVDQKIWKNHNAFEKIGREFLFDSLPESFKGYVVRKKEGFNVEIQDFISSYRANIEHLILHFLKNSTPRWLLETLRIKPVEILKFTNLQLWGTFVFVSWIALNHQDTRDEFLESLESLI